MPLPHTTDKIGSADGQRKPLHNSRIAARLERTYIRAIVSGGVTMSDESATPRTRAVELVAELHAILGELQTVDLSRCSDEDLIEVASATERAIARTTYAGDRQVAEAEARDLPRKTGYRTLTQFMNHRLRISNPVRRRKHLNATATLTCLNGDRLEPEYPTLAEAFALGSVGTAHVQAALDVLDHIPNAVDHDVKVAAERQMAEIAEAHTPADITQLGARLLAYLDPDGTLADDTERKRRRNLWVNRQRADGTAKMTATLTPELAARVTMLLAVWAKPGMNNPNDPYSPTGSFEDADPEALAVAAERDDRTPAQINHDALNALLKAVLDDGLLGKSHRGLPVQLIIKADLDDLIREAGLATTATGTLLPIPDLIAMAGDIQPWLAIFKDHTTVPLHFGRGRRLATREQRLVSFARPDGEVCSAPGLRPARHPRRHASRTKRLGQGWTHRHRRPRPPPPAHDTTGWSATNPANTPPASPDPDPTKAAASGDSTPNPAHHPIPTASTADPTYPGGSQNAYATYAPRSTDRPPGPAIKHARRRHTAKTRAAHG